MVRAALIAAGIFGGSVAFGHETAGLNPPLAEAQFVAIAHKIGEPQESVNPKIKAEFGCLKRVALLSGQMNETICDFTPGIGKMFL